MTRLVSLVVFLALVLGGGILIGTAAAPGDWYAGLQKPWFNPPNWVFAPVWTLLYAVIAYVGWRSWGPAGAPGLRLLWALQMVLNFLWSPVFFAAQAPGVALIIIALLLASIVAFIVRAATLDRLSAWLFAPYACWVGFATILNAAIFALNRV